VKQWRGVAELDENLLRRHLTMEQKKAFVAKLLILDPTRKASEIAQLIAVSDDFVQAVRGAGTQLPPRRQMMHVKLRELPAARRLWKSAMSNLLSLIG
jgi:hypothetical protein